MIPRAMRAVRQIVPTIGCAPLVVPTLLTAVVWLAGQASAQPAEPDAGQGPNDPSRCDLQLAGLDADALHWRGPRSRGFEPYRDNPHYERIDFRVVNSGSSGNSGACPFTLTITPTDNAASASVLPNTTGRGALKMAVRRRPGRGGENLLTDTPTPASGRASISGAVPPQSGSVTVSLFLGIESADTVQQPGLYKRPLAVSLFSARRGASLADRQQVRAWTRVPTAIDIAFDASKLGRSGDRTTLDLGRLSADERTVGRLTYFIRANAAYEVKAQSQNGGHLARTEGDGTVQADIPYRISLARSDRPVALNDRQRAMRTGKPTTADGQRFTFTAEVPPIGLEPAGLYQDVVVLTVAPAR